jgi:glycosyltransferase involved in cell wall biosynthesis
MRHFPQIVMVSKAMIVGAYQRKAEEIASQGIGLTVFTPPSWGDRRGSQPLERIYTAGYDLQTLLVRFNHNYHLHYYPSLAQRLTELRPHLLHMDEEPYNLATWLGLRAARRLGIPALFFTWQNIRRRYPPPFSWFEQANYRMASHVIAGNQDAAQVLRQKGYKGTLSVLPQFGVDAALFQPAQHKTTTAANSPCFTIGYAGGLLPEKGVDLLVRACAGLLGKWMLEISGEGSERDNLQALAAQLGVAEKVVFRGRLNSTAMPGFYQTLDVLVLPSRTTPAWKEQFGRVLIEAMACAVPVVGSRCGEIPHVIGDSELLFAEENVEELRIHLQHLLDQPELRWRLGQRARQRVLDRYTMQQIATQTVEIYRQVMGDRPTTKIHQNGLTMQ